MIIGCGSEAVGLGRRDYNIRIVSICARLFFPSSIQPGARSWFLDNPDHGWTPPNSLVAWMDKARQDGKAIVYIGFGSITVPDPPAITRSIIKAVLKSE